MAINKAEPLCQIFRGVTASVKIKITDFLFAENSNLMWIIDPTDLTIKQANDAACDLYGYSREEFLALTITDVRPEKEIPKLLKEVSKSVEGKIYRAKNAACQILGMSEEQIKNKGRDGLVYSDDKLQLALKRRNQTGEFSGELTFIHNSGKKLPVELTSSVFGNLRGQPQTVNSSP